MFEGESERLRVMVADAAGWEREVATMRLNVIDCLCEVWENGRRFPPPDSILLFPDRFCLNQTGIVECDVLAKAVAKSCDFDGSALFARTFADAAAWLTTGQWPASQS
jgi:hypothetical protein